MAIGAIRSLVEPFAEHGERGLRRLLGLQQRHPYRVGTRCFSSSVQFSTTRNCVSDDAVSDAGTTPMNLPSGKIS